MKYKDVAEARARVTRGGCRIEAGPGDTAVVMVPKPGVGLETWGAIDYLQANGFSWRYDGARGR